MDSLAFAAQLAQETGQLLRSYFDPAGTSAWLKPDRSLLTEADLAADRLIAAAIQEHYPGEALISEELHPALKTASGPPDAGTWVVDPLDGTTNFSVGLPIWGVSIARFDGGLPEAAAIHFPLFDELYTARRGEGAFVNGARLRVQPPGPERTATFFSCCSRTHRLYEVGLRYKTRILGSAAYTFCAVARGMAIAGFEATPKIWDIAGGWLVVAEAGGEVETRDGSAPFPLRPETDYRLRDFPTLAAAGPQILAEARRQLRPRNTAQG